MKPSERESKRTSRAGSGFAPGKAVGEDSLGSAVEELHRQHPHRYDDHGPHHEKGDVHSVKPGRTVR